MTLKRESGSAAMLCCSLNPSTTQAAASYSCARNSNDFVKRPSGLFLFQFLDLARKSNPLGQLVQIAGFLVPVALIGVRGCIERLVGVVTCRLMRPDWSCTAPVGERVFERKLDPGAIGICSVLVCHAGAVASG